MVRVKNIWLILTLIALTLACRQEEAIQPKPVSIAQGSLKVELSQRNNSFNRAILSNMRLFTFYSDTKLFGHELFNVENNSGVLSCPVRTGKWHITMVSALAGFSVGNANVSQTAGNNLLYHYTPDEHNNRSRNAPELLTAFVDVPVITENATTVENARVVRNVSKVQIIIKEILGNIDLASPDNKVYLHNVPNKIAYTGNLMPNATMPDTLAAPVYASLALAQTNGIISNDTISFIIPANKGDLDGNTISHKMALTVQLKKNDGSLFKVHKQIPLVAKCNEKLHVNVKVNAGIELNASVHPWSEEEHEIEIPVTGIEVDKAKVSMAHEEMVYVASNEEVNLDLDNTANWLTVTKVNEKEIKLTANVSTYSAPRSTTFKINTGRINKLINVKQEPQSDNSITVPASFWVSPTTGNTKRTIQVTSTGPWHIIGSTAWDKFSANRTNGPAGTTSVTFTRKSSTTVGDYTPYGNTTLTIRNSHTLQDVTIQGANLYLESGTAYVGNQPGNNNDIHDDILCAGGDELYDIISQPVWVTSALQMAGSSKLSLVSTGEPDGEHRTGSMIIRHKDDPTYKVSFMVDQDFHITIPAFHYFVLKYTWDTKDIDIAVQFEDNGATFDKKPVGWRKSSTIYHNSKILLKWGGDATAGQGETVFFNAPVIDNDNTLPRFITLRAYATWYTSYMAPRPVTQTTYAYLGGNMTQVGTNFVNTGGQELYSEAQKVMISTTKGQETHDTGGYTKVCTIVYDRIKHSARITWHASQVNSRQYLELPQPPENTQDEYKPPMEYKVVETFSE